jgi:hypothetical protein
VSIPLLTCIDLNHSRLPLGCLCTYAGNLSSACAATVRRRTKSSSSLQKRAPDPTCAHTQIVKKCWCTSLALCGWQKKRYNRAAGQEASPKLVYISPSRVYRQHCHRVPYGCLPRMVLTRTWGGCSFYVFETSSERSMAGDRQAPSFSK